MLALSSLALRSYQRGSAGAIIALAVRVPGAGAVPLSECVLSAGQGSGGACGGGGTPGFAGLAAGAFGGTRDMATAAGSQVAGSAAAGPAEGGLPLASPAPTSTSTSTSTTTSEPEFVVAYVTCPVAKARDLARQLVESRKAACVNIVPSVTSVYRWEGKIEEEEEALLIVKTRGDAAAKTAFVSFVKEIHPYSVPETIFTPILGGNPAYLAWLGTSTMPEASEADQRQHK